MDTEYGTVAERVDRGTEVLRSHGVTLDQLNADTLRIMSASDCVLGQAYRILYPQHPTPWAGEYGVLRDHWAVGNDVVRWSATHGFTASADRDLFASAEALTEEWYNRIRAARAAATA